MMAGYTVVQEKDGRFLAEADLTSDYGDLRLLDIKEYPISTDIQPLMDEVKGCRYDFDPCDEDGYLYLNEENLTVENIDKALEIVWFSILYNAQLGEDWRHAKVIYKQIPFYNVPKLTAATDYFFEHEKHIFEQADIIQEGFLKMEQKLSSLRVLLSKKTEL